MKYLREQGYTVAKVEQRLQIPDKDNPGRLIPVTRDAFNIADLIAVKIGEPGTLYVQTTTGSNASARIVKINENPAMDVILKSGNRIHVHGWAKRGPRGARKLWTVKVYDLGERTAMVMSEPPPLFAEQPF